MIKKAVLLFVITLLLAIAASAQTTTTYTVTNPVSGVYGTPFRAFSIPLSDGAEVNWLEAGANTSCGGQTTPAVGFIFVTLPGQAESPCAPLIGSPSANVGSFQGVDANGTPFSGSYSFTITTAYKCSGGRGGGCHTVFTIQSGTVTVTE